MSLPSDAIPVEIDRFGQGFERRGRVQGTVRPVLIMVDLVRAQDPPQMGLVPDKGAVQELAPLTFTDENIPDPADPVIPAARSLQATIKDAVKQTPDGLPLYRYRDLLEHLATLDRQIINFSGQRIEKLTLPTPVQARAFGLLGSPVPVRIT